MAFLQRELDHYFSREVKQNIAVESAYGSPFENLIKVPRAVSTLLFTVLYCTVKCSILTLLQITSRWR